MQTKTSLPFKKILHTQHRDSLKRDINMSTCALHQSSSCIPGNDSQHMNVVWDNKKSILGLQLVNPTPDHKQVSSVTTTGRKGQGLKKGAGGAGKTTEQGIEPLFYPKVVKWRQLWCMFSYSSPGTASGRRPRDSSVLSTGRSVPRCFIRLGTS